MGTSTVRSSSTFVLWVVEASKLLHLNGMSSIQLGTASALALAYVLPFVRHVSVYLQQIQQDEDTEYYSPATAATKRGKSTLPVMEILGYIVISTVATVYARRHYIAHDILETLLFRDPTEFQQTALCVGIWLLYLAGIMFVFFKSARLMRRYESAIV